MGFNKTTLAVIGLSALLAGFAGHELGHAQNASATANTQQESKSESAPMSQSPESIMTLHASSHLVLLDVSVFDWKDSPVTGLTKGAFQILEDGHEQSIMNLEEHAPIDPAVAREQLASVAAKLPPNTFTNFKPFPSTTVNVVLDAVTSRGDSQRDYHGFLVNYMKTVPPGTPFIIFKLDSQLHLVQGLTMDPDVLRAAVALKPGEVLTMTNGTHIQKQQIVGSAVDQLTRYLAATPGRKTLLWFSGGLGHMLSSTGDVPVDDDTHNLFCKWTDSLQQNRIDVYRLGSDPPDVSSGLGCHTARKCGDSIASAVDCGARFYTLSYIPTNANWDGKYRKIKVNVNAKGTPWKGIGLDYREGYYGRADDGSVRSSVVSAQPPPNGESLALQQAMGLGAPAPSDVVFEATVNPDAEIAKDEAGAPAPPGNFLSESLRTQGYRTYGVRYAIRANQLSLIAAPGQTDYAEKLEVVTIVDDSLGHPVNSKRSVVTVNFNGPDDPRLQQVTVTADLTTQVPAKGDYFLRIGVHDLATDKVGALEIPVDRIALPGK